MKYLKPQTRKQGWDLVTGPVLADKMKDLCPVPGNYTVEREYRLPQVIPWLPHTCCGIHADVYKITHTHHTHILTVNNLINVIKVLFYKDKSALLGRLTDIRVNNSWDKLGYLRQGLPLWSRMALNSQCSPYYSWLCWFSYLRLPWEYKLHNFA